MNSEEISARNRNVALQRWGRELEKFRKRLERVASDPLFPVYRARLLGYLVGDGWIERRAERNNAKSIHYSVRFYPDDEKMLESYIDAFKFVYGKSPKITKLRGHFLVRCCSKGAVLDLLKCGSFDSLNWRVPFTLLKNKTLRIEWLRPFFDCEAYVSSKVVRVESVSKKGLQDVRKLLNKLNIEAYLYVYERKNENWNTNYILVIARKSIARYCRLVGFTHSRKAKDLARFNRNI